MHDDPDEMWPPSASVVADGADASTADADAIDAPTPAEQPRLSLLGKIAIGVSILLLVVFIAGFLIHVPYSTIAPGEAVSLTNLVKVEGGKTFPTPRGDIRLLFVRERNNVNLWRYLQARLDSDIDLFKEEQLNPGNEPQGDLNAEAAADMADAKLAATKVALQAAGYTVKPATSGVLVQEPLPSKPAGKVLKAGDVIVAADGMTLRTTKDLRTAIAKHKAGESITLDIKRKGEPRTVHVKVADIDGTPAIGVRVSPIYDFPIKVDVDTEGIGGPSGGLAMTLAIFDDLTAGDLTGGQRVAVTGTMDPNGNVGEIGGIAQKAVAAKAAHAKLFIVPKCAASDPPAQLQACQKDLTKATQRAGSKVKVIPVGTFDEALQVLRDNGGATPVTTRAA
jgi:PDZ domain-containing protein